MKTLHNMKFRILSPEHSEEIQRELFRLGFRWIDSSPMSVKQSNAWFLFAYVNEHKPNTIDHGNAFGYFKYHKHTETTLEELKAM